MALTREELRTEVERLIDAGDEAALEKFALDHFAELPEDIQGKALLGFISEALEKNAADADVLDMKEKTIEAMDQIAAMKAELEKEK